MVQQVIREWCRTLRHAAVEREADSCLLSRFVAAGDEIAFAALVRRHGPLVWSVCQRVLFHHQDTEDAFQATFLVLARRAKNVGQPGQLANWLFGVARRTARNLLRSRDRRSRLLEAARNHLPSRQPSVVDGLPTAVDEELERLPDRYRLPILLCCLEGKSHVEAAASLAWPTGTVAGRLSRGRELLRTRLRRRGIEVTAVTLATALGGLGEACLSELLIESTALLAQAALRPEVYVAVVAAPLRELARQSMPASSLPWVHGATLLSTLMAVAMGLGAFMLSGLPLSAVDAPPPRGGEQAVLPPKVLPSPHFVRLPADPGAEVLRYELVDPGTEQLKVAMTLRSDGTLQFLGKTPLAGQATARLAIEEVQDLLQFIVHDQQFCTIDADALGRELRWRYQDDGAYTNNGEEPLTRIRLRTPDYEREVTWSHLESSALMYRECPALPRLLAVARRLKNLWQIEEAGGTRQVAAWADAATRLARQTWPDQPPFAVEHFQGLSPEAGGKGQRCTFARGIKYSSPDYFSVTLLLSDAGPPRIIQANPGPSYQVPSAPRRMCLMPTMVGGAELAD